jgi:hypothetical protein
MTGVVDGGKKEAPEGASVEAEGLDVSCHAAVILYSVEEGLKEKPRASRNRPAWHNASARSASG